MARLEFDVAFKANNWGTDGRTIDAHRMLVPWTHLGATWNCADDADPSDGGADCDASAWEMGSLDPSPFDPEPSGTMLVTGDLMGTVSIDVTDDVVAMIAGDVANHRLDRRLFLGGPTGLAGPSPALVPLRSSVRRPSGWPAVSDGTPQPAPSW